jgi:hypothetical protein
MFRVDKDERNHRRDEYQTNRQIKIKPDLPVNQHVKQRR